MQKSQPSAYPSIPFHRRPVIWLRNKLLAGLALALPLVATFWILEWAWMILHGWSQPILAFFATVANEVADRRVIDMDSPGFMQFVKFVGVLIPLIVFVLLGVMATNVIGVRVVSALDRLLGRVPLVSFVYKSLKQVIDAFKGLGARQNFKRVVYVDYPAAGARMLGFVTGEFYDSTVEKTMVAVFVPGALSPMTGLLLVVEAAEVVDAPISIEDAMKLIFSGGLVVPNSRSSPRPKPVEQLAPTADDVAAAEQADVHLTKDLPPNLPRAEDFDFGDPDILASAAEVERSLFGAMASRARGWRLALPWRRRG